MKHLITMSLLLLAFGCGGEDDRPEDILKVRGIGLSANPLVSIPSTATSPQTVDLTVIVAAPKGTKVTFDKFTDQDTNSALLLNASQYDLVASQQTTKSYNGFDVISAHAKAKVPGADKLPPLGGKVRVGFRIKSTSNEERFIGSFLVVPASDKTRTQWKAPSLGVQIPKPGLILKTGDTVNLVAKLTDANGEDYKVGWFVDGGKITQRRSLDTFWETPAPGNHTILVTIRGKKSLGFAMDVLDVKVQ